MYTGSKNYIISLPPSPPPSHPFPLGEESLSLSLLDFGAVIHKNKTWKCDVIELRVSEHFFMGLKHFEDLQDRSRLEGSAGFLPVEDRIARNSQRNSSGRTLSPSFLAFLNTL